MSPKPDGSKFEWEQKLASATVEALDDLESDAKEEINAFCEQAFSTLKERGVQKIHYLNMLRTAMSKKREVLTPHEQSNPASATSAPPPPPLQPNTTATSAPPPPPLGAGGPPPPPPPPLPSSAGPQAPSAHALKQQEEKRKRDQRQQALAAAKQRGISAVEKNEGDALVQIKKKANADLKEIQQKIRDFKNEIAYEGGLPLEKLAREREEVKKNVDDEINDKRNEIERLLKQMSAIEKNDRLKDIKADVEGFLRDAKEQLKELIAKKDQTLANINAALAKYDNGIERLELELETQKAYVQGLLEGSKTKSEAKAKANKTPEQILNDAFASQDLEFAKLEHYNDAEKAVIRAMLYRLNPKSTGNENALLCNEPNLQKIFQPAIKFQKIKYSDLKKELGRSLFEDEKKPDKIAKPPKSDAPSVQDQPGLAGAGMNNPAVGVGGTAAPGIQQPPPYVAPSGPQKDISQEDTALKILKNIFKSIDIKDRYARAGGKKSFVSMYIKKQHKDRPKQIDDLQAAVAKATSAIEALSTNVDNSNNQQNLKAIFDDLDKTMKKIKADMQQAGHKFKGTSRMENVLKNLELETQKMRAAVGIEESKPRESKKMN